MRVEKWPFFHGLAHWDKQGVFVHTHECVHVCACVCEDELFRVNEMAWWVKTSTTEPDDLSLIHRIHIAGKNQFPQVDL